VNLQDRSLTFAPQIHLALLAASSMTAALVVGIEAREAAAETIVAEAVETDLQALINQAKPGEVVTIAPGVYNKPIKIEKPLTLKGSDLAKCVLELSADQPALTIASKGRVTIEGLTIKWQLATSERSQEPPCAVVVKDSKVTIQNCRVIALGGPKRCPAALQCTGFSDVKLQECRFEGFDFCINYSGGAEGSITDCVVLKSGHCGITVYADSKIEVARSIVTGSRYHGIRSTGGTLAVHDNLIVQNENRGIYLGNKPARGYVRNNVILNNGSGISAFGQSKVAITNNLLLNSNYVGLDARDSCQLTVKNNIFQGNPKGFVLVTEGGRSQVKLGPNSFWSNAADTENVEKPRGSFEVDPRFQAAEQGDYTTQAEELTASKQGLTDPSIFVELWKKWDKLSATLR